MIVTDLDGTLLNSEQKISEYTKNIVNHFIERGGLFTYATARSYSSASKLTACLNIRLPIAAYNGAFLVEHSTGRVLEACTFDKEKISGLLAALEQSSIKPLVYAFVDGLERVSWISGEETSGITNYLNSRIGDKRLRPATSYEELFAGDIFHMNIIGTKAETDDVRGLFDGNSHVYYHVQEDIYTGEFWLEALRYDATKEQSVMKLKKLIGAEKVIVFGDNINDIPMFRCSDECYAVENAKDELKRIATGIIRSNDNDGVAKWMKENLL